MSKAPPVEIGDDEPVRGKVYFILDKATNALKIGFSTDLPKRFADLRTATPGDLALIGYVRARRDVESSIHNHLASERIRGEWFRTSEKTTDVMDEICEYLSVFDTDEADGRDLHVLTAKELQSIIESPTFGLLDEQIWRRE